MLGGRIDYGPYALGISEIRLPDLLPVLHLQDAHPPFLHAQIFEQSILGDRVLYTREAKELDNVPIGVVFCVHRIDVISRRRILSRYVENCAYLHHELAQSVHFFPLRSLPYSAEGLIDPLGA